jgi:hypothetical protein
VGNYPNLITNALDLISFLMVMPKMMGVVAPTTRWLIRLGCLTVFGSAFGVVIYIVGLDLKTPRLWLAVTVLVIFVFLSMLIVSVFGKVRDMMDQVLDSIISHVSDYSLLMGGLIFFISRLIALYASAPKAGFFTS